MCKIEDQKVFFDWRDLPEGLRRGIPGEMARSLHTTFWGKKKNEVVTTAKEGLHQIGLQHYNHAHKRKEAKNMEAEEMYRAKGVSETANARQAFSKAREVPKGDERNDKITEP